jgi:ADP-heptose:LPS heptosyltransferase/predicted SAM-dependent methyltransferase
MVWKIDGAQGNESKKIVWEVAPYLRGYGLDLGAGDFRVLPHVTTVDNCHHNAFGYDIRPDVRVETCEKMPIFGSQSVDFVYSSHLLEHIVDYKAALTEWWRLIKVGGYLVLYLPHKDFYPNIGVKGSNPDHKHDFLPTDIIDAMQSVSGGWDMVECQERNEDEEYSMLLVFKRTHGKEKTLSCKAQKPEKTALVCRFGAFGDLMQASSVFAGLKEQGYHITLMCSKPGVDVVLHDPNIDAFMLLDKDQVPNANLVDFWRWQEKKYTKFVNLSESVEGTWLALPGRTAHGWRPLMRHTHMNYNYLQFQHELAGVPHNPQVKFFPTLEEKEWARKTRSKMGNKVVLWSLAGSSVHKTWAGLDQIIASIMLNYSDVDVVLCGGEDAMLLEAGWEAEKRVHLTCGKWEIRQTLTFIQEANLVIGPETGVLNAAACMDVAKIVFLSHSSHENLTRDWVNTTALQSKGTRCKGRDSDEVPACHMLHYGWSNCTKDEETGTAQCQKDIGTLEVWDAVLSVLDKAGATLVERE